MSKKKLSKEELDHVYLEWNGESIFIEKNALHYIQEHEELSHLPFENKYGEQVVALAINANGLFWRSVADSEHFLYEDIEDIFNRCFDKEGNFNVYGTYIWVCLRRKMRPRHSMEKLMKEKGVWCDELEALPVRDVTEYKGN